MRTRFQVVDLQSQKLWFVLYSPFARVRLLWGFRRRRP